MNRLSERLSVWNPETGLLWQPERWSDHRSTILGPMSNKRSLTATQVTALKADGVHWIAPSLYLQIRPQGTRSWLFRYIQGYRDTAAIHAKLDEIIVALRETQNDVVGLEHEDVKVIKETVRKIEQKAKQL